MAAIVIALLVKGLYPADLPQSRNPDFIDNVFANRAVLWAARLLLVSAAGVLGLGGVFIAASIGIRMKNGEWLRRAGPFEISERKLGQAKEEIDFWRREALASEEEVIDLRKRLASIFELTGDLQDPE
ncbi:MAG TPA: hypothetical protein VFS54_07865 [Solirubrobacterales bacterium]|nr:hypothetical protein [Solirubrobacterales bacterium]